MQSNAIFYAFICSTKRIAHDSPLYHCLPLKSHQMYTIQRRVIKIEDPNHQLDLTFPTALVNSTFIPCYFSYIAIIVVASVLVHLLLSIDRYCMRDLEFTA